MRQRSAGRGPRDPQPRAHRLRHRRGALLPAGFGRTSSTTREQTTPRNLFGFKDGTANLRSDENTKLNDFVWVADGDGPVWLTGGTYLVARRIRMRIEQWDRTTLLEQERVIGRQKAAARPWG